ncbi:chitinase [Apiospora phragmitis]|uniref:Chitinase n=1 Tax=Apiospora phragmitis TaxID=2905665 RepID=A0ABR1VSU3_9PEZI
MINHKYAHYPSDRWEGLHADAAWVYLVRIYKDTDSKYGRSFMESVESTFKVGADLDCGSLISSNCNEAQTCSAGLDGKYSGPAAQLIYNSLVKIHQMYAQYHEALFDVAASEISNALDDLENKFAPIPAEEDNTWLLLLIDLITVGTLSAAGPFFNSFLKRLPYFVAKEAAGSPAFDNLKDTTMNLIGQSTTIAKDLLSTKGSDWTAEKQDSFTNYMGQTITGWGNVTSVGLAQVFNGSDASLDILWDVISDGKLVKGWDGTDNSDGEPSKEKEEEAEKNAANELRQNIAKSFFGYAIPALWQVSKTYAFVIDSGYACDDDKPLGDYLDDDTMEATGDCVDGRRYYLAYPDGEANKCECHYYDNSHCERVCRDQKFSAPPGLDSLDGTIFGRITRKDLITGSVRTWRQNGKANGGTIDNLLQVDVTTPGFMRLPVCSPERAFQSWDTTKKGSSANYPCDIPPGRDTCGDSTFENQSSGASPKVEDCLQIVRNIEGDGSTDWTTQVVGKNQREIAKSGSCHFGVEATKVNGNVNFVVGGQDVIDIINEAVKQFGGDGRVGAKGNMDCNGNTKQQAVKWGIY